MIWKPTASQRPVQTGHDSTDAHMCIGKTLKRAYTIECHQSVEVVDRLSGMNFVVDLKITTELFVANGLVENFELLIGVD